MQNRVICALGCLVFLNVVIFVTLYQASAKQSGVLSVSFLDIGQGDSIYIEAPNGRQMIIDGGPNESLMSALPDVLQFGDKTIDVLVVTNPDADHYSGFIPLIESYEIGAIVESGTISDTSLYDSFQDLIFQKSIEHVEAYAGQKIFLDKENNIYLEILFPDRDVATWDSNDGSIVSKLVYGNTSVLLMGDSTKLAEGIVVSRNDLSGVDILKAGHHGSKTSTGLPLLIESKPSVVVISAGEDNRYGHPDEETIENLNEMNIPYLVTMDEGTITFISDGETFIRK
jgi:competence protein ComEC